MNELIEKIKKFFGIGKKKEVLALNEGNGDRTENTGFASKSQEFRKSMESEIKSSKTWIQEINDAINRYKDLTREEINIKKEENILDKELMDNFREEAIRRQELPTINIGLTFILGQATEEIHDRVVELYENDPSVLQFEIREELIEQLKGAYTTKSGETIEELLHKKINKWLKTSNKDRYLDNGKISEEEFIHHVIESRLKVMDLEKKLATEILSEKFGIKYVLINSLNENFDLPEELEDKYESSEDYKNQEKANIKELYKEVLSMGTQTPSEEKALEAILDKVVLEKTALQGNLDFTKETIEELINDDKKMRLINPEATRYHRDWLRTVLKSTIKGSEQISADNNSNTKYIFFDEKQEGPYKTVFLEGKKREEMQQEQ